MKLLFVLAISALALTACSSNKVRQEVEAKAAHSTVTDPKALGESIHHAIESSKSLNAEQKAKLYAIIEANKQKATALAEESFQFRSVLINELLSEKMDPKKVKILKSDIKKIENKKLKNTFNAIEQIIGVVSNSPDKHNFTQPLKVYDRLTR